MIGTAEICAEKIRRFRDAGVQLLFVWPALDPLEQLERFTDRVLPLVN